MVSMRKQIQLLSEKKYRFRKTVRPVSTREYMHCVFKSDKYVLRKHARLIRKEIQEIERRFGVKAKSVAIMPNHIHMLIKVPSRILFANAMRYFAGVIGRKIKLGKLWRQRLWARVVRYGKDFRIVTEYVRQNPVKAGCFEITVDAINYGFH